jgi:diguanylate cyclase (GGDEF)-like protein/putative nucleotidyltransferase with HDIG domain
LLFAVTYFGLNSWLIAFVIAFQRRTSAYDVWRGGFLWLSLNYFCGASLAVLLVGYNRTIDLRFVAIVVPLLLVLYFTFKTSMQRVEEANQHVDELNTLYLSTIETLAMAVDAKDQVTHGHIRRVQSYATNLAREVGVRDDNLIKAIEAAALLHDMGKLAVPEYILNKPGKLTNAEFEKMKLHASVGADILSAIAFPYPVVPIVRHHHENWDGSGYPAGLKGTNIPIGARILSVVDCFDALSSDRPYRPRLSDDEAMRILVERRGTMYDPLIIDTFVKVHKAIAPEIVQTGPPSDVLNDIASARNVSPVQIGVPVLEEIAASADEMLTLYELARGLAGQVSVSDAGDVIANHVRRLIPSSLSVFYLYDRSADELEARHAVGDCAALVRGLRIPLGQRLSGWVGANRRTISNSDPTLDLGDLARSHSFALRSCISTPLLSEGQLVGVLSLYSGEQNAFNEDHRRIVEVVARQIANTFERAVEFDTSVRRDPLTGLPPLSQLERLVHTTAIDAGCATSSYALLFIDVINLKQIYLGHGHSGSDEALQHMVRQARAGLRVADILFRNSNDEFVAFLNDTDAFTSVTVMERIRKRVAEHPVILLTGATIAIELTITSVCFPDDGRSLSELLAAARHRGALQTAVLEDNTVH